MRFERRINFLAGPNGSGKTRCLSLLAQEALNRDRESIAISNTPFTRLPRARKNFKVLRINPLGIRKSISESFKKYFSDEHRETFHIPDLLDRLGFYPEIEIVFVPGVEKDLRSVERFVDGRDYDDLNAALESVFSKINHRFKISGSVDSFERSLRGRTRVVFKYLDELKDYQLISSYRLMFSHRKRGRETFSELSSGEQTLISTFLFIKSNINEASSIFIDEPENSLHPAWQKMYVEMLHIALGYSEAKLFLATHSPVLMSGAISSHGDFIEIFKMIDGDPYPLDLEQDNRADSIEEILWEVFDTVTPVNHFLSVEISEILQDLSNNKLSYGGAKEKILSFINGAYDAKQKKLLEKVFMNLQDFLPGDKG